MDSALWLIVLVVLVLAVAGCAAVLLVRVLRARRLLLDAGVPLRSKALFWTAVVYTVSPLDLIPDPVYLDDVGVLLVALRALHAAAARSGAGRKDLPSAAEASIRGPKRVPPPL
ncbi:YkvA family protein [Streptomyces sp. SP18CS02]|uniref:YkvA family protein n=1 Tax=Streptomyces sp. SP18CS02 TaxID=3002531 RepID=UPI002E793F63|nr:YkvA family protein [Streptomyces sp. SP18CS02]MEE1751942.1 YkvA family protein [Streptomyces sp. SP18CS02]